MKESIKGRVWIVLGVIFLVVWVVLLLFRLLQQGIYSGKLGMNIAIVGDKSVGLLMLRPEEGVVGWVVFPENLKVKIYNSEAKYPIGSLWGYGVLEKNPFEVVEKTVGLTMGVVVSRTIQSSKMDSVEEVVTALQKWGLKTDLSFRDRVLIRNFLTESIASKKILEMDIPGKIFDKTVEPDGKEFLSFNSVASLWTKNKFVLESILSENVDLVVNNLTGQPGLGTQVARQLESAGLRVIEVKSDLANGVEGRGCLFSVSGSYPYTESLLTTQMSCRKIETLNSDSKEEGIVVWVKN